MSQFNSFKITPFFRKTLSNLCLGVFFVGVTVFFIGVISRMDFNKSFVNTIFVGSIVFFAGVAGGAGRRVMELAVTNEGGNENKNKFYYACYIGGLSGAVVPLFLKAGSSDLIGDSINFIAGQSPTKSDSIFLLVAYCVLAGTVGNSFLSKMAQNALLAKVDDLSASMNKKIKKLEDMQKILSDLNGRNYIEAYRKLGDYVNNYPDEIDGWARLAYTAKRLNPPKFDEAKKCAERAMALEKEKSPQGWKGNYPGDIRTVYNYTTYAIRLTENNKKNEIIKILENFHAAIRCYIDNNNREHFPIIGKDFNECEELKELRESTDGDLNDRIKKLREDLL